MFGISCPRGNATGVGVVDPLKIEGKLSDVCGYDRCSDHVLDYGTISEVGVVVFAQFFLPELASFQLPCRLRHSPLTNLVYRRILSPLC